MFITFKNLIKVLIINKINKKILKMKKINRKEYINNI